MWCSVSGGIRLLVPINCLVQSGGALIRWRWFARLASPFAPLLLFYTTLLHNLASLLFFHTTLLLLHNFAHFPLFYTTLPLLLYNLIYEEYLIGHDLN